MTTSVAVLLTAIGIVMLGVGASWLVDGSSRLALRLGIPPMIVGITVVGFGTSMPELLVSVLASARGSGGLSIGNAVGSNIMNLLLVLGVSAMVCPITMVGSRRILQRDMLFGLIPAFVILPMAWNGYLGRPAAALLIVVFAAFMAVSLWTARKAPDLPTSHGASIGRSLALTAVGIVALVAGADLMVRGGVALATSFGVSEAVIGLTLVAFGTSLPELATSVAAALKGQTEISVGNILGSNVFNLGLIVGTAFMIRPGPVPPFVIRHDIPFLVIATLVVGPGILHDGRIKRYEGFLMLLAFLGYLAFIAWRGIGAV